MSDAPQGAGWWQASDGKWYPPQPAQPPGGYPPPEGPPGYPPAPASSRNPWQRFRRFPLWAQVLAFIILGVIGAATGSGYKNATVAAGSSSGSSSSARPSSASSSSSATTT